jgi:hypothetical protein
MNQFCQIEFANDDVGMPCGKPAVAKCSDCGSAICSDCQMECCGDSFCGQCYDYHVTHSCVRKPAQAGRNTYPVRESFDRAS